MHALMQAKQGDSRTMIGMTTFVSKLFMLIVAYDGMHFMTMQAFESSVIASIAVVQILNSCKNQVNSTSIRLVHLLPFLYEAEGDYTYCCNELRFVSPLSTLATIIILTSHLLFGMQLLTGAAACDLDKVLFENQVYSKRLFDVARYKIRFHLKDCSNPVVAHKPQV